MAVFPRRSPSDAPKPPLQPLPKCYSKMFPFPVVFWIFGCWMRRDVLVRAEGAGAEAVAGYQTPSHSPRDGVLCPWAPQDTCPTRAVPGHRSARAARTRARNGFCSRRGWFWAGGALAEAEGLRGEQLLWAQSNLGTAEKIGPLNPRPNRISSPSGSICQVFIDRQER